MLSCFHSLGKYLLATYYAPGTVLGAFLKTFFHLSTPPPTRAPTSHFEILPDFRTRALPFHFPLGPTNYAASPKLAQEEMGHGEVSDLT